MTDQAARILAKAQRQTDPRIADMLRRFVAEMETMRDV